MSETLFLLLMTVVILVCVPVFICLGVDFSENPFKPVRGIYKIIINHHLDSPAAQVIIEDYTTSVLVGGIAASKLTYLITAWRLRLDGVDYRVRRFSKLDRHLSRMVNTHINQKEQAYIDKLLKDIGV